MSIIRMSRFLSFEELKRVGQAFCIYEHQPPTGDTSGGGAFVMNVVDQYRATLRQQECLALIAYGLEQTCTQLQQVLDHPDLRYSLNEIVGNYIVAQEEERKEITSMAYRRGMHVQAIAKDGTGIHTITGIIEGVWTTKDTVDIRIQTHGDPNDPFEDDKPRTAVIYGIPFADIIQAWTEAENGE